MNSTNQNNDHYVETTVSQVLFEISSAIDFKILALFGFNHLQLAFSTVFIWVFNTLVYNFLAFLISLQECHWW